MRKSPRVMVIGPGTMGTGLTIVIGPGTMGNGLTAALMAGKEFNSNRKESKVTLLAGEGSTKEEKAQESNVRVHERH